MFQQLITIALNTGIAALGVMVLVGWIRNRAGTLTDIDKREISPDLSAGDDLVADVLTERTRAERAHCDKDQAIETGR
jgi:hypothetical protein